MRNGKGSENGSFLLAELFKPRGLKAQPKVSSEIVSPRAQISIMKKFLSYIRIEEYVLYFFCCFLFCFYCILLSGDLSTVDFVRHLFLEAKNFSNLFYFFFPLFVFLGLVGTLRSILWLKKRKEIGINRNGSNKDNKKRALSFLLNLGLIFRNFVSIIIFFIFLSSLLGLLNNDLRDHVMNIQLLEIDRNIFFGNYPFILFQDQHSFLRIFDFLIVYSFNFIPISIFLSLIFFYFQKNKKLFKQFLLSFAIVIMLSMPFWYFFPANSPQNAFISNLHSYKINNQLKNSLQNYFPTNLAKSFQVDTDKLQKQTPPVTTFPSMHTAWSLLVAYFFWKFSRKFAYFFVIPWAIFSITGTVYLAQHYFIDIILAIPMAIIAIDFSLLLVKLEERYYRKSKLDIKEDEIKATITDDFKNLCSPFKFFYEIFAVKKKNKRLL